MFRVVRKIQKFCNKFPGEKRFGYYRFLPFFFIFGAGLEYTMIHWKPNGHNFCKSLNQFRLDHLISTLLNCCNSPLFLQHFGI
ncbi:UNVERIFIED_CONTAM: hypothetical protein PYX00_003252 [Menopon gallinae]|uniref:Small integral membrane protein 4 n=1 Tax=Menopon gallinae TaxID=328185 RepID=A0AAW2I024_9NEOP